MADKLRISRRDFMNGVALSLAAGTAVSPLQLMAAPGATHRVPDYPPALTGLRGNHAGSFEVAHALAWTGRKWPRPDSRTDALYDLVVVGGGISGLAAAWLWRQRAGPDARILVLDNHDDFGGHAKRNEFEVDGRHLIGYGGSQSIDGPGKYSAVARQLLSDIAIDTGRFYDYYDQDFFSDRQLGRAVFFGRETYGRDVLAPDTLGIFGGAPAAGDTEHAIGHYPISEASRQALLTLLQGGRDPLSAHGRTAKIRRLRGMSYRDFLLDTAGATEEVADLLNDTVKSYWGVGWDALSALEGYRLGAPGTQGLDLGPVDGSAAERDEPYIFHFPDGNAGIARSLVRRLIPVAVPGRTMEDVVSARVDYGLLDRPSANTRIRLNSTGVDVRHRPDGKAVEVTYVNDGEAYRVAGKHVVLACYNNIIPHLCPELPAGQREAIAYASKAPLVYLSIAVRNWRAFARLGYHSVYIPQAALMHSFGMDFPVSMGDYHFTRHPDQPSVIHGTVVPTEPNQGLTARQQYTAGRRRLYELSFDDFEKDIVRQMNGALSAGGFAAERDIAAITVNRWPHGYAYEYNDLSDPPEWGPDNGPHIAGRAQLGRISIANSDASAYAYVNGAVDAAHRAVSEQLRDA